MAVIKCKMCGGDLELVPDSTVCECAYCGTRQTVPSADSEKMLSLFHRAGKLLRACEFDKAYGVYESIVNEFPDEAEAYWGLVLCKFGIEYVDDPATGKKVPTCHRAGFESVEDDVNFEQACENADAVARRVYREEGRAIDELRERIIEVSGKEEPYDIFISYKELAEDGERTEDSVLAQDIYDALTAKGYRVFFSRVTLEDKLGVEYEPYIFAALQSAKVMLLVGMDYENLNAVWVKNEWSRYLALMAQNKEKMLIPCYKGMDPYDLPKEVRKLAAQDMGKVGAMQDLLRGVEKIISPKKEEPATAAPQPVVMSGGPNVIALQKRGMMALEDAQWDSAKDFFNQVLNMDAENAEAWLGLALADGHYRSEQEYIDVRKSADVGTVLKVIPDAEDQILAAAEANTVPGFLSAQTVRELFRSETFQYESAVEPTEELLQQELESFDRNRNFSRAIQFARGETMQHIPQLREILQRKLQERLESAKQQEQEAYEKKAAEYAAHCSEMEEKAAELRRVAEEEREAFYQKICAIAESLDNPEEMKQATEGLARLGDYRDAADRLRQCEEKREKLERYWENEIPYRNACRTMEIATYPEAYEMAIEEFSKLDGYRDSAERIEKCKIEIAAWREKKRTEKIDGLMKERKALQEESDAIGKKALFNGKAFRRKNELDARIMTIDVELKRLGVE